MDMFTSTGKIVYTAIVVLIFLYVAFCLQAMAKKKGMRRPWLAWIPLVQAWVVCKLAGRGIVWTILLFVPIVDIVFLVIVFLKLSRAFGYNRFLGLLMFVPLANYVLLWVFAFGERGFAPTDTGNVAGQAG